MTRKGGSNRIRLRPSTVLRWNYWWYFAAIGALVPYLALYYRHLGLNGLQVGVLAAVTPLGTAFLAPLWGTLGDTYAAHRLVLRIALCIAALAALLVSQTTSFWLLLPLMLLLASAAAAIPALLDGYAMTISEREGQSYGRLRMWGTAGFIAMAWLVGWMMGENISSRFLIAYATALGLTFVASFGLPPLKSRSRQPLWQGVASMVREPSVALLLLTAYMVMSSASIMGNYLGIYLSEIGGTARIVGTASVVAALSELPVLAFGTQLIDRFTSRRVFLFAVVMYVIRFALYSVPPTPQWVLAVQVLHGVSFGAYLMASVTLIHQFAGRERAATAQGVLASIGFGFAAITGSLVGGALLDRIGAVGIFRVATVGMGFALLVCLWTTMRGADTTPAVAPVLQGDEQSA